MDGAVIQQDADRVAALTTSRSVGAAWARRVKLASCRSICSSSNASRTRLASFTSPEASSEASSSRRRARLPWSSCGFTVILLRGAPPGRIAKKSRPRVPADAITGLRGPLTRETGGGVASGGGSESTDRGAADGPVRRPSRRAGSILVSARSCAATFAPLTLGWACDAISNRLRLPDFEGPASCLRRPAGCRTWIAG